MLRFYLQHRNLTVGGRFTSIKACAVLGIGNYSHTTLGKNNITMHLHNLAADQIEKYVQQYNILTVESEIRLLDIEDIVITIEP